MQTPDSPETLDPAKTVPGRSRRRPRGVHSEQVRFRLTAATAIPAVVAELLTRFR